VEIRVSTNEKDVPVSSDYKKSMDGGGGPKLPDFLTRSSGVFIGLGVVVLIAAIIYGVTHIDFSRPVTNPLESRPGFVSLKQHVESLAEVDALCAKEDRTTCLCELADRIREDRRVVDSLLEADPSLKTFQIAVRKPASATVSYDLAKLPQAPAEADCLNAVAAPTIIDDDASATEPSK
jgi:hypothetical protein